jgi:hypothetical protein
MTSKRDKPWHKNASNLLVVNSILAAISALVIQTTVSDSVHHSVWWLALGAASLFLFVLTAERIAEAFSDDDVQGFVHSYLPYNLGVLLLFLDLAGVVRHYGHLSFNSTLITAGLAILGWWLGWGCDTLFLIIKDRDEFPRWIKQLEGEAIERPIEDPCDKIRHFVFSRFKRSETREAHLPHAHVYTRLRPSRIHGVGVFAVLNIAKGTRLFLDDEDEIVWIDQAQIAGLPSEIRSLYDDFAIIKHGKYGCPVSFNRLTMSWYLNDSDQPNIAVDDEYCMTAVRDIAIGEELTIDSSKFSAQPYREQEG